MRKEYYHKRKAEGTLKRRATHIQKDKRQAIKYPKSQYVLFREALKKYDLGIQGVFDYLVVSGIVYRKTAIVDLVKGKIKEKEKRFAAAHKNKSKGRAAVPIERLVVMMYDQDWAALNRFCIEENVKKFWLIEILFDEFIKENPILIEQIDICRKLNITERVKQVARLTGDEYVRVLPSSDQEALLDLLTRNYDEKNYDGLLLEELEQANRRLQRFEEDESLETAFAAKIEAIKRAREALGDEIAEPIDLDSLNDEDSDYGDSIEDDT